jgi:DNA modification methylase
VERLVLIATNTDELILDPFAGSGTLAVAAERHGRRWLLIESQARYVEIARQRLAAARTGESS